MTQDLYNFSFGFPVFFTIIGNLCDYFMSTDRTLRTFSWYKYIFIDLWIIRYNKSKILTIFISSYNLCDPMGKDLYDFSFPASACNSWTDRNLYYIFMKSSARIFCRNKNILFFSLYGNKSVASLMACKCPCDIIALCLYIFALFRYFNLTISDQCI